jgi:alpha-tubulin suppressor-like RCC1 family protein
MQIGTGTDWDTCKVQLGGAGCLATKTDGTAWIWGINYAGALGLNQSANPYSSYPAAAKYSSPTQLPGTDWGVITGNYHRQSYALRLGT